MELIQFIGRAAELAQLKGLLIEGAHGRGSIVFIEGEAGLGKSLLLEMVQTAAHLNPELDNVHFTYGYCHEETGASNAYQPLIEILDALTKADQRGRDIAIWSSTS